MVGAVVVVATVSSGVSYAAAAPNSGREVDVRVTVGSDLLQAPTDGRVVVMFAPEGNDPLDNPWAAGPNKFYGMNVFDVDGGDEVVLAGGDGSNTQTQVFGYPHISLDELPAGQYRVQAFLTEYETFTRSDGSVVSLRFPCGDGSPIVAPPGSLRTPVTPVTIGEGSSTVDLSFRDTVPLWPSANAEIGGCSQGNYADPVGNEAGAGFHKHAKIKSDVLTEFWGRDMFLGANITLPAGYDPADTSTRYPVLYVQAHWPGPGGGFGYPYWEDFARIWNAGERTLANGETVPIPKFIMVMVRNETPYYDDSYGVNSANAGPWGDAINDELVPFIDRNFNTIAAPYGRIQEGCSTGGWIAAASTIFRPDLYGAAFSYCPDSLDFNEYQDIPLYTAANAYFEDDGTPRGSIREFDEDGKERVVLTVEQENHWELVFGNNTRSFSQWDAWSSTYGAQGLNGYPLEPWNKVTGEIEPAAVDYWHAMDMADYVTENWAGHRNLGQALEGRLHISVGDQDNYYLNQGTVAFKETVEALGGPTWADITVVPGLGHGGFYDNLDIWVYLDLVHDWVQDHAPDGPTALTSSDTSASGRGNDFDEVLAVGGHAAALARQVDPEVRSGTSATPGQTVRVTTGKWDPGVRLTAQWMIDGAPHGEPTTLSAGVEATLTAPPAANAVRELTLAVTGRKDGYATETRTSSPVTLPAAASPGTEPTATPSVTPSPRSAGDTRIVPPTSRRATDLADTGGDTSTSLGLALVSIMAVTAGMVLIVLRRRATRTERSDDA